jgi:hypothetical protein
MSRELLVWGILFGTCFSASMVMGILPYPIVAYLYALLVAVLNFYILLKGSKNCCAIGIKNHCYTILFFSICIFTVLFVVSVLIEFITMICWLWVNDWKPVVPYQFHNWIICFSLESLAIIIGSLIIMFCKDVKMCPNWADDSEDNNIQDYDEADCEFTDYEEMENLPAK